MSIDFIMSCDRKIPNDNFAIVYRLTIVDKGEAKNNTVKILHTIPRADAPFSLVGEFSTKK